MLTARTEHRKVPPKNLVLDPSCQLRSDIRETVIQDYADVLEEAMAAGRPWPFPAIDVFWQEGSRHYVADGWHRTLAAQRVGWKAPVPCIVHPGDLRQAILFAAGANADHGIRRSNEDKRRAVLMLLKDREWRKWATAEIARRCNVSCGLVEIVRRHEGGAADPERRLCFGGDGKIHYRSRSGDRRLAREDSPRGERARRRIPLQLLLVSFAREPELARREPGEGPLGREGAGAGGEKCCHWRRGHWAMVACGKGRAERRRVYRAPVLVRADRFVGDKADTVTVYK